MKSNASEAEIGDGLGFRHWTYAMISAELHSETVAEDVCADTGCGASLVDREWHSQQSPKTPVSKMASSLRVRGIGSTKHETSEFVTQHIYLPATDDQGKPLLVCL